MRKFVLICGILKKTLFVSQKVTLIPFFKIQKLYIPPPPLWGTPYKGLYGDAPPKRGTFFQLEVYEMVRISRVEV